jgi:hypothetical protein
VTMEPLARRLLEKLLAAGNRFQAGTSTRRPSLTGSQLEAYRSLRSLAAKEAVEAVLQDVAARGFVTLDWPERSGFVQRVTLHEAQGLATYLGTLTAQDRIDAAGLILGSWVKDFPVLQDVIDHWSRLRTVRSTTSERTRDWIDAARAVQFALDTANEGEELPLRVASMRLFNDSKRLQGLWPLIDVLLSGSVDAAPSEPGQVWQELGLYKEEQLMRLAGNIVVIRDHVTARLDAPFLGLPMQAIKGLGSAPKDVMIVENQTNFNVTARAQCHEDSLLVYSGGMPSPAWLAAFRVIVQATPPSTPLHHWGDFDEGGFRIAARIAKEVQTLGRQLLPWRMRPSDIPESMRVAAPPATCARMARWAEAAGWIRLREEVAEAGFVAEQEGLLASTKAAA